MGCGSRRAHQAAKGDMVALQHRQLIRDGPGGPPPHWGLLRAAHTHHGGGRGLTGTPPNTRGRAGVPRGFGVLREQPRRCGYGTRALRQVSEAAGSSPGAARCSGGLPVRGCRIPPGREGLQNCR